MPKIQTSCPNCKQPMVAEIHQVVDVKKDPRLKELLLSGAVNLAQCQVCGFQGQLPVPLVYHDGEKELLFTFTPPDANKTMEEKESALAPLLKQVTDSLTPEERKGYLFQPQAMLTMNNLIKNVLLADGITEEMIQAQQDQMMLLEKFLTADEEQLKMEIRENQDKVNREFFALFAEIAQQVVARGDEESIKKIKQVQDALMEETEIGKSIKAEAEEIKAATQSLEALGNNLTRASLLELIIAAPNIERVKAFAGLVRPAMDYEFFKLFTDKIEGSDTEERKEMVERRNLLLKLTQEIDKQIDERVEEVKKQIDLIIENDSIEQALLNNIGVVDQLFIQILSSELSEAKEKKDEQREEKLTELLQIIQRLTTPPELEVLESLLSVSDNEEKINELINELDGELMSKVIDYLTSIISNYDQQIDTGTSENLEQIQETQQKLKLVFNSLLRKSMEQKMKGA
jgi:hypothetical protein